MSLKKSGGPAKAVSDVLDEVRRAKLGPRIPLNSGLSVPHGALEAAEMPCCSWGGSDGRS
jgi:hypothetical protein